MPPSSSNTWGPLLSDLLLGRSLVDRAAWLRPSDRQSQLAAMPARYLLVDQRGHLAVHEKSAGPGLLMLADPPAGEQLFLGVAGDAAHFAVMVDREPLQAGGALQRDRGAGDVSWENLRTIAAALDDLESGLATTALALANWHGAHVRCPRCGTPTIIAESGWRRDCPSDGSPHFPRTDPAVIVLLRDADDCALLGRAARWPQGAYSTLAGFVEPGETAEAAVVREVGEEVGLLPAGVTYLGSQPWPFPASLMLGYHAQVPGHAPPPVVDGVEIVAARWVNRAELPSLCEAGEVRLPSEISIANRLVARWFGGPLPRHWCRW